MWLHDYTAQKLIADRQREVEHASREAWKWQQPRSTILDDFNKTAAPDKPDVSLQLKLALRKRSFSLTLSMEQRKECN